MVRTLTLDAVAAEVAAALGTRLVSFLMYGSGARGDAPPGAPVDTLLICDDADDALLAALEPVVRRWVAGGQPPPLVLTAREWRTSADTFAIEYADIRASHRVLAGADPWAGIVVDKADERRQLERELRGKVLRLRQGYLAARGDARALDELVRDTAGSWLTMMRAVLRLAGRPVPDAPADVVRAGAALAGFPPEPVAELVAAARGAAGPGLAPRDPRVAAYLAAVARTAEYVDSL
jgi:hypothetical protein